MEFKITDLLDDVQDIPLDISSQSTIRKERVKALTMLKIRKQANAQTGHFRRFIARLV